MKLRNIMVVGIAAPALMLTACGSEDGGTTDGPEQTNDAAPSAQCEVPEGDIPTGPELLEILNAALDPAVPEDEKAMLIEGGGDDPELWAQLSAEAAQNPDIQYEIPDTPDAVFPLDECTLSANFTLQISPDQPANTGSLFFVAEDGRWKLSRDDACNFVTSFALETDLCG
ncbi:hypothetical protein HT102_14885 [Hoyosella sp. G463]|uniref:Low molecular weight antigen MTB12-like C-terminal domain-containing protein n=1 Tax=Lolliginicoccus lacisalsi TaxID=2742202 RepID=A0A927PN90_9ACTN|nr:hypothetical protein [Lolliginicoccus lacisalsi]MBD8507772.1 hypothetical protein [Lolliginicoccus lacisalsi]